MTNPTSLSTQEYAKIAQWVYNDPQNQPSPVEGWEAITFHNLKNADGTVNKRVFKDANDKITVDQSLAIWNELVTQGYIDNRGNVLNSFNVDQALNLSSEYAAYEGRIRMILQETSYGFSDNTFFNGANGYNGAALYNAATGQVIVAHRGTEAGKDHWDVATDGLLATKINLQEASAKKFYALLEKKLTIDSGYTNASIALNVGHSLGGGLAQLMTAENEGTSGYAITFNAAGAAQFETTNSASFTNITNYIHPDDWVASVMPHLGTVQYLPTTAQNVADIAIINNGNNLTADTNTALLQAQAELSRIRTDQSFALPWHDIAYFTNTNLYNDQPPTESVYRRFALFRAGVQANEIVQDSLFGSIDDLDIEWVSTAALPAKLGVALVCLAPGTAGTGAIYAVTTSLDVLGGILGFASNTIGTLFNIVVNNDNGTSQTTAQLTSTNQLNLTASSTQDMQTVLSNLNIDTTNADKINSITVGTTTYKYEYLNQPDGYEIQSGDTIAKFANETGFSIDEILAANSWLDTDHRVSPDKSFVMIMEGEKLYTPTTGNANNNTIWGTNQGETLDGQEGNDHLIAGGGDDTLIGGSGNNLLEGGAGNDTLKASTSGKDVLLGGIGNDTYEIDTRNGGTFEIVDADGLGKIKITRNKVDGSGVSETLDINGANRIANMWSHWPIWLRAAEGGTIIGDWNVNNLLSYYYFNQNTTIEGKTYEANDLRIRNLFPSDWEIVIKDFHNNQDYLGINFGFNWNGNGGNPGDTWSGLPYQGTYNPQSYTPLVLDFNDDAQINSIDLNYSGTYFDVDNDGIAEKTGWIMPEDGFLAYDRNNNGKIDSINELFGNKTTNGFTELSYIDSNEDRVFDNRDDLFTQIKIWQDFNLNGKTDADELKSLAEHNIESININSLKVNIDSNGNTITDISFYKTTDGQEHTMWDIWFKNSNVETKYSSILDPTTNLEGIPLLKGWGDVIDLHLACAQNADLKEITQNLAEKTSAQEIEQNFDDFIAKWAGLDVFLAPYEIFRQGLYSDCDRAWITQTLMGETFLKNIIEEEYKSSRNEPSQYGGMYNSKIYQTFKDKFLAQFLIQTVYQEYFQGIEPTLADGKLVIYDQEMLIESLNSYISKSTEVEDFLLFRECVLEVKDQVILPQNIVNLIENPFIIKLANYKKEVIIKIYEETNLQNGYLEGCNYKIPEFVIPQFNGFETNLQIGEIGIKNYNLFKESVLSYIQSISRIFELETLKVFITTIKSELPDTYLLNYLENPYLGYQIEFKTNFVKEDVPLFAGLDFDFNAGIICIEESKLKTSIVNYLK
ncbi:hypothetical protein HN928_06920, partial [bacterium]|nr:hypothetical protein [bacterium]